MTRAFDDTLRSASKRVSESDTNQEREGAMVTLQYRVLYTNENETLSVVRRMGYEEGSRTDSGKYSILHNPTRVDLGILFDSEAAAREFVRKVESKWDWEFKTVGKSDVNQDILFQIAGRLGAKNFLGGQIIATRSRKT